MSLQKLINNYSEYNSWANSKFVDWLQIIGRRTFVQAGALKF